MISFLLITGSLFAGGTQENDVEAAAPQPTANAVEQQSSPESRIVTDLAGNAVELPPASELKRTVIIAPPLVSTFASLQITGSEIVGTNKIAFGGANKKLLDIALPGWSSIPTGFLTGFKSNTEELLKLKPDVILVYGNFQKEGLEGVSVPILDFFIKNMDNEVWSVKIENLMREIYELGEDVPPLQQEWDLAKSNTVVRLEGLGESQKKGIMIMSNTGDKITVRGIGSYGDDWLKKSGILNAADLQGDNKEVTMEQLYAWNPDIIYIFRGMPASKYVANSIPKQDWSHIEAVKNCAVYDTPWGLMNWGAPNADSPLMLQWMVSKNFPEALSEDEFISIMKDYYSRRYSIELSEELIESTLYPNGK